MIDKDIVKTIVETYLAKNEKNLFLIDITVSNDNRILVEIDSDNVVSIEDCMRLSREIEAHFDRDVEDFELEVGSSGITSPFKNIRQYRKNIGNEIELLLREGRKIIGVLDNVSDEAITLSVEKMVKPEGAKRKVKVREQETYSFDKIKSAKYLIRFK